MERRSIKALALGIGLLITALFMALLAMTAYTVCGSIEEHYSLEPSKPAFVDLVRSLPSGTTTFNMSVSHTCRNLTVVMMGINGSKQNVIERKLNEYEKLNLVHVERMGIQFLSLESDTSCEATLVLSYIASRHPLIWLVIPSFVLMLVGSILALQAFISIMSIRVKARKGIST